MRLLCTFAVILLAMISSSEQVTAQQMPAPKSINDLVAWVKSHNKAPFDRDSAQIPKTATTFLKASPLSASAAAKFQNVKVNQDRNPWPKAEVGAAVDPSTGKNYVVMTNDFRENWDLEFYHVSTNGGKAWTDDAMVGGFDPYTGGIPLTFQSDPGVALDSVGHSVLSAITGNQVFDFVNGYENLDTEIEATIGNAGGTYTSLLPTVIDFQPCNGTFTGAFTCTIQLDKPLVSIDNVPGSPNIGTVYVYYTAFCLQPTPCVDGNATIPAFGSSILEAHSPGAGLPFGPPNLVSGQLGQEQFSDIVVDSHGVAHAFFDDFSTGVNINMYMSTFNGSSWVVNPTPIATFVPIGTASPTWVFRITGTIAPGCGIRGDTAYCAFSSNQVGTGPTETGMSVYLAIVNTQTGATKISRVNNDPFNDGKDHFFPWATATANGVYVGWYDDRNDPFNTLVQYFVGKSKDGGTTFAKQIPVNDVPFNPCVGFPGCSFFGDYTQLVSGPDRVVHAAWSDTRDGASMQVWSQAITW
jgi:hypothetical protein